MLRVHAPPDEHPRKGWQVRIDGELRSVIFSGASSEFDARPGRHVVRIGGRLIHSKPIEFVDDGETITEVAFGSAPGGFVTAWTAIVSVNVWRFVGDYTSLGAWSQLMLVPTFLFFLYNQIYGRFGGTPAIWLTGETDPRALVRKVRMIARPLPGYPYAVEQLEPDVRELYLAQMSLIEATTDRPARRVHRVRKPLRGYPYHPDQLSPA